MQISQSFFLSVSVVTLASVLPVIGAPPSPLQIRQSEPSPTGRGACIQQGGSWVCEIGNAISTSSTPTATSASVASSPSVETVPTEPIGEKCHYHGSQLHCEEEATEGHEGHSHAGHSHGPSEEYGCGLAPLEDYNLGLHIAAIFILLASSFFGVLLPALGGVILSTAFVHLLFHAFVYLSNECVGGLKYEAASPAIAMGAIYLVFLIDLLALRPIRRQALKMERNRAIAEHNNNMVSRESKAGSSSSEEEIANFDDGGFAENKLAKVNVLALEAGIIFHSVIIGVTIGTASGEGWIPLLIAIVFHQFCEGLGLASRIALLPTTSMLAKSMMYLAFVLTTPVGIAIGIGVRRSYNGNDRGTLLAIGILDSISAGILLYSALVQILVGDFINNKQMLWASKGRVLYALTCFTLGAVIMSILALWA